MSDDHLFGPDLDLDSLEGQAEAFRRARQAIDAIGRVDGVSDNGLVRVWVTASGEIVDIELADDTRYMDRDRLSRLIVAAARQASFNAAAKVAEVLEPLEKHRQRLLEDLEGTDAFTAATLRDVTADALPDFTETSADTDLSHGLFRRPWRADGSS
ncbi:YbaB/EbfC family nucleoid-associated protein [Mycolicibacterium farcinogenes]|uniref:YbaB/EbfC family nucleoid-associated protein n=1 Tax=Mycolicibacterium farcinogenes TaxID=1802 RepID=UPI001C8D10F1|nr:YbaB/EbfC family nucleoid-associated protein [Mycolicibacterium farcinogenes]QZH61411.1 YbaB/EbfC family nucleoid-associated protein [Mycolicibacterium farcinogenes]